MYLAQPTEELAVSHSFIPATGALTIGILISVCKDVTSLGSSSFEACKELRHAIAFHYTGWRWEQNF